MRQRGAVGLVFLTERSTHPTAPGITFALTSPPVPRIRPVRDHSSSAPRRGGAVRVRSLVTVAVFALAGPGCRTPTPYESNPLPRFLIDLTPAPLPEPEEPPQVPVAQRPAATLPDAVRECAFN